MGLAVRVRVGVRVRVRVGVRVMVRVRPLVRKRATVSLSLTFNRKIQFKMTLSRHRTTQLQPTNQSTTDSTVCRRASDHRPTHVSKAQRTLPVSERRAPSVLSIWFHSFEYRGDPAPAAPLQSLALPACPPPARPQQYNTT